jgi:ATP-dependent DNA ligase
MVSRAGSLPTGEGWSSEPKYDGFRAVISTEREIRVRSRRGWEMGPFVRELQHLAKGLVLDCDLVAWKGREPHFPVLCRRGSQRRYLHCRELCRLGSSRPRRNRPHAAPVRGAQNAAGGTRPKGPHWNVTEVFDDGRALYDAMCELGLEGGIAKRTTSRYGANRRGWVKVKNPNYWRRDLEREAMRRSRDRRAPTRVYCRMGARSILEPVQLWAAS